MSYVVAIFLVDRAYGGPEEGGWWYDCGEPAEEYAEYIRGFSDEKEAIAYKKELNEQVVSAGNVGRREIGSVLSTGRYAVRICDGLPKAYPSEKPHYE